VHQRDGQESPQLALPNGIGIQQQLIEQVAARL